MLVLKEYGLYIIYDLVEHDPLKLKDIIKTNFENGTLHESIEYVDNGLTFPKSDKIYKYFTVKIAKSSWSNVILKRQMKRHIEICKKLNYKYLEPYTHNDNILFLKKYHKNKLINYKIDEDIKIIFPKALNSLLHLHKLGYAHGNITPSNIVIDDEIYFINFECSVSQHKKETHCKKIDLKYASKFLIDKHNLKYPRRSFKNALLDDIIALILSFAYILIDKDDKLFLKDLKYSRHLSVKDLNTYHKDANKLPDTFLPYMHEYLKLIYIEVLCLRYNIITKLNHLNNFYGKDIE